MNKQLLNTVFNTLIIFSTYTFASSEPKAFQGKEVEIKLSQSTVEKNIEQQIDKELSHIRQNISDDAVKAVNYTNMALLALENNKQDKAIAFVRSAVDKLGMISKHDSLAQLRPIYATKTIHKLIATGDEIEAIINASKKHLENGNLQQARIMIDALVSDVTLTTTSIPLGTYTESIKRVIPLIDKGKNDKAKRALSSLLNTLVVKNIVIPIPPLQAKALLMEAEILAGKENRTANENKTLSNLLKGARDQLRVSQLLGYGDKTLFKPLYEQIDQIEKNIADGKVDKGRFEKIKQLIPDFLKAFKGFNSSENSAVS